jgi:hypothetical protein
MVDTAAATTVVMVAMVMATMGATVTAMVTPITPAIGDRRFFYGAYAWPYYGYPYGYGGCDPYYGCYYGTTGYSGGTYAADPGYGYVSSGYGSAPPAPPVVVNQTIGTAAAPQSSDSFYRNPDYYLIAFSDHTIRAAASYRVDGGEIYWTSREGQQMQAPLSSVDRRFSEQINRDRRVAFPLQ